jgi:putative transposase
MAAIMISVAGINCENLSCNKRGVHIWEEGSHPQLIESETVMRQKLDYIHQNPVKRGYVDLPEHWRYSSARNYLGLEGLIEVVRAW